VKLFHPYFTSKVKQKQMLTNVVIAKWNAALKILKEEIGRTTINDFRLALSSGLKPEVQEL